MGTSQSKTPKDQEDRKKIEKNVIIGIIVGIVAILLLCAVTFGIWFYVRHIKKHSANKSTSSSTSYNKSSKSRVAINTAQSALNKAGSMSDHSSRIINSVLNGDGNKAIDHAQKIKSHAIHAAGHIKDLARMAVN